VIGVPLTRSPIARSPLTRFPLARKPLARKIDHLSRGAHAFHRFAHHPLCGEYASEVFRIGRRVRVCRGCTLAAIGALAGTLAGIGVALATDASWIVSAAAVCVALLLASAPLRPAGKIATRLLPAGLLAFTIASGTWLALLGIPALIFCVVAYRRRGPERALCPERSRPVPCRGFAAIVRRERAFERVTGSWLYPSLPRQR
jgi:hypothetical protein